MIMNNQMQQGANPYYNPITPLIPQGMVWVKDKNEAMNYPMARGTTLPIFDSNEDDIFYVKSVDVYGNTQPLRKFRYEEITDENQIASQVPAVSVDDFNALKEQMAALQEEMKKLNESKSYSGKPNYNRKENRNNG